MQAADRPLPGCIARYARAFHAAAGPGQHVGSPLGAWILLALCAPAADEAGAAALAGVLGCAPRHAARAAAGLLASPHPLVGAAAAAWSPPAAARAGQVSPGWLAGLPAPVARGDIPPQAGLDRWSREHTFGLIGRFPLDLTPDTCLVLACALAARVSWQRPFELAPAAQLGRASPWAARLDQVLRAPAGPGHQAYIAPTAIGDAAVHVASARGGLLVVSVIAAPDADPAGVLAAAHELALAAAGGRAERRSLFSLPLGDGPAWTIREEPGGGRDRERCTAVLPAWSADSTAELDDPRLGFPAAVRAVAPGGGPWAARQAAAARYSRTGFEAAAVSAGAVATAMRAPAAGPRRVAELRFGHPYAVVAVTLDQRADGGSGVLRPGPWHGLPVFSAWVADPADAGAMP